MRSPLPAAAVSSVARSPRVFIVDDDVPVRESLEALVHRAGWHAETFAAAHGFLAHPRVIAPSCLLLDVSLPDLNGLDLQERLAADRDDMPIIFITGYGDVPMTVRAMTAGAMELLTRPFDDELLLAAIPQAIDRSTRLLDASETLREPERAPQVADPARSRTSRRWSSPASSTSR